MTEPKRYSLADVRRSYDREKARREMTGELPAYLFYRPLSFPVSYLALRSGIPTVAVTWSGLLAVRGDDHCRRPRRFACVPVGRGTGSCISCARLLVSLAAISMTLSAALRYDSRQRAQEQAGVLPTKPE